MKETCEERELHKLVFLDQRKDAQGDESQMETEIEVE